MRTSNTEYINENSCRNYPFADDCSLTDTAGSPLPTDFIVDAHLYPMDLQGYVYLSSIDLANEKLYFADSVTGQAFGVCIFAPAAGSAEVLEIGGYQRVIGLVLFGDGAEVVRGSSVRTFTAEATMLVPTAFTSITQVGVRGILLPDGSVVTGDVTLEGTEGIQITSSIRGSQMFLRIDAVGVPPTTYLGPAVCTIVVEQSADGNFAVSQYDDNTVAITLPNMELDSMCAAKTAQFRKSTTDPCNPGPPVPPVPPVVLPAKTIIYQICLLQTGVFQIVAPSAVGYINPISIQPIAAGISPARITVAPGESVADVTTAAEDFATPDMTAGGITLGIQGLS